MSIKTIVLVFNDSDFMKSSLLKCYPLFFYYNRPTVSNQRLSGLQNRVRCEVQSIKLKKTKEASLEEERYEKTCFKENMLYDKRKIVQIVWKHIVQDIIIADFDS